MPPVNITAEMGEKDRVQSTEYMREDTHLQRWGKKTKSRNPSLQEYIDMECEKVLYSTTKKGNILEVER
jgi:hypothetical protein